MKRDAVLARVKTLAMVACLLTPASAWATGETVEDEHGTLNGQELTLDLMLNKLDRGIFDPMVCMYGYWASKSGNHAAARKIFIACADRGVAAAMPWMANLEENGLGGPEDPKAAAAWDKRAADMGYSIGLLNYGLDLLRGHGVERDEVKARQLIDRAAAQGDRAAKELIESGYDWRSVTPDADEHRYEEKLY